MTLRVTADNPQFIFDDSFTPPRVVGIKQRDGSEHFFPFLPEAPSDATVRRVLEKLGTWQVLAASAVAVPLTGSTDETALATVAIPAGAMGANGFLRITMHWSATNDASAKDIKVRLGGLAGTALWTQNITSTASMWTATYIANRNSAASQIGHNIRGFGVTSGSPVTATVNTAVAQDLVISGQHADGTDTLTLESYLVELLYKA